MAPVPGIPARARDNSDWRARDRRDREGPKNDGIPAVRSDPVMRRVRITVSTTVGSIIVTGESFGAWSITPSLGLDGRGWTVTHVKSGMAVIKALDRGAAVEIALALQDRIPRVDAGALGEDACIVQAKVREVFGEGFAL